MENFNLTLHGIRQVGPLYLLDCLLNQGEITKPTDAVLSIENHDFLLSIGSINTSLQDDSIEKEDLITLATLKFPFTFKQLEDINVVEPIIIKNCTLN